MTSRRRVAAVVSGWHGPDEWSSYPTLGYKVAEWIEEWCVIPDGLHQGEPYRLTNEMLRFLLQFFRLHPDAEVIENQPSAAFVYRGAQLMRPQKWGKSPFGAAICLANALGPVVFDGWDARGEPKGRPHPTPWVQIVATSEEQTDNIWLALLEMASRGKIASLGLDIGVQDINLPSGGKIEPCTSSGRARLGARSTFVCFDEPHLMTERNGGVLLATTMKRNSGPLGGRWLETTNAYDPSEASVAQRTQESGAQDVLVDYRPPQHRPDLDDIDDALNQLRFVYRDSWWVDINRILADARDPAVCPSTSDAMRYFFNRLEVGVTDVVDPTRWEALKRDRDLGKGQAVALGFHGSRSVSCTSIVASRLSDGRWFHLRTWDPADHEGQVPRIEVDQVVTDAFAAYDVRYLFGDPANWQTYFDQWESRWPKRIVEFSTNSEQRMDAAIRRFIEAFNSGSFTHDGDSTLGAHVKAAALTRGQKKRPRPEEDATVAQHYLKIVKKRDSGGQIDAFVAGVLAEEARGYAIEKAPPRAAATFVGWR
jgi:hypothetical protein